MDDGRFRRGSSFCIQLVALLTMLFAGTAEAKFSGRQAEQGGPGQQPVAQEPHHAPKVKSLQQYREGEVLVKYKKGVSRAHAVARMASDSLTITRSYAKLSEVKRQQMFAVKAAGKTTAQLMTHFRSNPDVEVVSPNYLRRIASTTPNDTAFGELWGLRNTGQTLQTGNTGVAGADIRATQAWDRTTGSTGVVIADIDTGITPGHLDLQTNLWHNPGEIPGNGIDDDGNGYVDDVYGINAISGGNDVTDDNGHGTHTAGTIAASGNNGQGITGVAWQSKIMTLKFLDAAGSGTDADAIECINYIVDMKSRGVNIVAINASWGGGGYDQLLSDAIQAAGNAGIVFAAAAGNETSNNDAVPSYPASYDLPNIISVAASDLNDQVAWFSNYGASTVDLFAPGVDILSTVPGVTVPDPATVTYFSDDMESGPAKWVTSGGTWAISSEAAHGGSYSWSDSPGGSYPNSQNTTLELAQPVNLAGATTPAVSFWVTRDLESYYDYFYVDISADNGATWQNMLVLNDHVTTWAQQSFAIPPAFRTSAFKLRFWLTSDSSVVYDGVHIDDVRIVEGLETGTYAYYSGTSMATPHVTGAVALAAALYPAEGVQQRVDRILTTVDPLPQFSGVATGGRLNLYQALGSLVPAPHVAQIDGLYGTSSLVTLQGDTFGQTAGTIVLDDGAGVQQNAQMVSWTDTSVTFVLPEGFTASTLIVRNAAGGERVMTAATMTKWSTMTPMSVGTFSMAVVAYNGMIYMFDGYINGGVTTNAADVYNPATSTWSPLAPTSVSRANLRAGVANDKIYIVGGYDNTTSTVLATVEEYDPQTNSYALKNPLPTPLSFMGLAALNDTLYLAGGSDANSAPTSSLYRYDQISDSWLALAPMATPRSGQGMVALNNRLWVFGGYDGANFLSSGEVYDPATNSWSPIAPLPAPRYNMGATTDGTYIYAVGGAATDFWGSVQNSLFRYDPIANTWQQAPFALNTPVVTNQAVSVGTSLYSVGGFNGATESSSLESLRLDFYPPTGTITINGGAATTTSTNVTLTFTANGTGSTVIQRRLSTDGGVTWAAGWEPYSDTQSFTLPSGDGVKIVSVQFQDAAGNLSAIYNDTITLTAGTPPTGTVVINGGASFTNSIGATLTMTASGGSGSGVTQRRISKDGGITWATDWESYTTSRTVTLPSGDGAKIISVQFRDSVGNVSTVVSDTIILDTVVPTGAVSINGGAAATNLVNVTLTMTANDGSGSGVVSRRISKDGGVTWATGWEPFTTTRVVTLPSGDGTKTLTVQLKDAAGNVSGLISDTIKLDTVAPTGTISINNGAATASNVNAVLTFTSSDGIGSGVTQLRVSADNVTWGAWESYVASRGTVLNYPSAADGVKTRYVQFKDAAGNISATYSDSIILDTAAPTGTVSINGGAAATNLVNVTLTMTANDGSGSGVVSRRISKDGGVTWATGWEPFTTTRTVTLPSGDGMNTITIQLQDASGKTSALISDTIILDTVAPLGTISINGGAAVTNNLAATLTFTADGTGSGVTQLRVSADNITWGNWETYVATRGTVLNYPTAADGVKTRYVQFKDAAGNISATYSDSIILDTAAPTGTVSINGGAAATNLVNVTLTMTANDGSGSGVVSRRISKDGGVTWATGWEPFTTTRTVTLPSVDGMKTITIQLQDAAGNTSALISDSIILDTAVPTGTVVINGGAAATSSTSATLTMTAVDGTGSGVISRRISTDGGITWGGWEPFTTTRSIVLASGDGIKTITVQFQDAAGNTSALISNSIILDTTVPTGTVVINGGAAATNSTAATLTMTAADVSGSGVISRRISNDGGLTWVTDWEPFTTTRAIGLTSGDGTKTITVQLQDAAGNLSALISDSILLDTTVPTGTISINSGAVATNNVNGVLTFTTSDGTGSGVTQLRLSTDNVTWGAWESYVTTRSTGLNYPSAADGVKTRYVQFKDAAGNISAIYSDTIILDTVAPTGTMLINGGAATTGSTTVALSFTTADPGGGGVTQLRISYNGGVTWATGWETYTATRTVTLSSGDGVKSVSVQFLDAAGNMSGIYTDTITLSATADVTAPTGTIVINGGAAATNNVAATLTFTATDDIGVTHLRVSADNITWGNWETYATTRSTVLNYPSAADGVKTRYVQFKDAVGNISATYSDSIILDTVAPSGTVVINGGAATTSSVSATLTMTATDGSGSGGITRRISKDGGVTWATGWETFTTTRAITLPSGDGVKAISVQFQDAAGNVSPVISVTITLDTVAPSGTVVINGGAATTDSVSATLTMTATDGSGSGGITRRISKDGGVTWATGWETFTTTRAITLPSGDGVKTISVQFQDAAGNVSPVFSDTITLQTTVSTGRILGQVKDAVTGSAISGVTVTVTQSGNPVGTTTTGVDGTFIMILPVGTGYTVSFSHTGHQPTSISNVTVTANTDYFLPVVLQIDTNHTGPGSVSGKIINAFSGQGVPGAVLSLRAGINVISGTIVATATATSDGTYTISSLAAGNYTAEVSAQGYTTAFTTIVSVGGVTTGNQNVTLTPVLQGGETRIVLTWGSSPSDLDSHLTGPDTAGGRFHTYYSNKTFSVGGVTQADLDLDDITSYGPETTTIYVQSTGTYRFSVHDYSNRSSTTSTAMSASGAVVKVYQGATQIGEFNVPANTGGTLWTVFELNGNTLTPINAMTYVGSPESVTSVPAGGAKDDGALLKSLPPKK